MLLFCMHSETGNKSSQVTMAEVDLHSAAQPTSAGEPPPNPTAPYPTAQPTSVGEPPPPYSAAPGSTSGEEVKTITFAVEPPAYPTSSTAAIPQHVVPSTGNPSQQTGVVVVTSQPQSYSSSSSRPQYYSHSSDLLSNRLFVTSLGLCIFCFFCGSPCTVLCFGTAMLLAKRV